MSKFSKPFKAIHYEYNVICS